MRRDIANPDAIPEPWDYNPSGWRQRLAEHPDPTRYLLFSTAAGVAVAALDALSITLYYPYAHLLVLVASSALVAFGFWGSPAEAQGTQNLITVALLLTIFAILSTEATSPPPSWRDFHGSRK